MKTLLTGSILTNIVLIIAIWFIQPTPKVIDRGDGSAQLPNQVLPVPSSSRSVTVDLTEPIEALVTDLKLLKFPDGISRLVIADKLAQRVRGKRQELLAANASTQVPGITLTALTPMNAAELRRMEFDNQKFLNETYGPNTSTLSLSQRSRDYLDFGPLEINKIEELRLTVQDYSAMTVEARTAMNGVTLASDIAIMKLLDTSKDESLRDLLSPAEYDEYLLRSSTTANALRAKLAYFYPTESEFRNLFALQRAFDQMYVVQSTSSPQALQERASAQVQLSQDIREALGPDRWNDFQRATDTSFVTTNRVTNRLGLTQSTAIEIWQIQHETQSTAEAIRSSASLTESGKVAALTELKANASNSISLKMGGSAQFGVYQQFAGTWIKAITR